MTDFSSYDIAKNVYWSLPVQFPSIILRDAYSRKSAWWINGSEEDIRSHRCRCGEAECGVMWNASNTHIRYSSAIFSGKASPIDGLSDVGMKPVSRPQGRIELKNVFFRYPTRPGVEVCKVTIRMIALVKVIIVSFTCFILLSFQASSYYIIVWWCIHWTVLQRNSLLYIVRSRTTRSLSSPDKWLL